MKDLTNEQLCKLAQAGDEQAVSLLIEANLPFVRKVANQIVGNSTRQEHLSACGVGFDDLVQAGSPLGCGEQSAATTSPAESNF